ncbi:MAG: DUF898 domain-containing protein [Litoreibacter sp.]|nr:DUF898 domain-containing protein [Litoreibacter sp.]
MDNEQFVFKGDAREWFGIWIVNLLLSLVTLGIYSAWAKVRRKKYFYNNTYVAGRNFDYHATGLQILIGRAIVAVAFVGFSLLSAIPIAGLILGLVLIFIFPWLMVRSLMFNARMSSWSNVRFNFSGTVKRAFLVYLIYPILTFLSLGATYPMLDRAVKRFAVSHHRLGTAELNMEAGLGPFYRAFLAAILWVLLVFAGAAVVMGFSLEGFLQSIENIEAQPAAGSAAILGIYVMFFAAFLPAIFIYKAMTRNAVFNATTLEGGHGFRSDITAGRLMWIAISNMVVVVLTFGLMLPWAQIRMMRYLVSRTQLVPGGSLDGFVDLLQKETSALGDAYTDLEGLDLGLPI